MEAQRSVLQLPLHVWHRSRYGQHMCAAAPGTSGTSGIGVVLPQAWATCAWYMYYAPVACCIGKLHIGNTLSQGIMWSAPCISFLWHLAHFSLEGTLFLASGVACWIHGTVAQGPIVPHLGRWLTQSTGCWIFTTILFLILASIAAVLCFSLLSLLGNCPTSFEWLVEHWSLVPYKAVPTCPYRILLVPQSPTEASQPPC